MAIKAKFELAFDDFELNVDLNFPTKGVTTLFGPSGSGKSTLLRCLAGLERSPSGYMQLGGQVWQDEESGVFLAPHQRALSYVFQEPRLFSHLNVQKNLEYGFQRTPKQERRIRWDQMIDMLDLSHLLARKPDKLSGGEQQRVSIGRALLTSPELLLMDEPLAALDMARKQEVLPFIRKLHDELDIPVVYVSHSLDEILQITDTMILIQEGQSIAIGSINELCSNLKLSRYLGDMSGSVIDTVIDQHDETYALSILNFTGGQLYVPRQTVPIGTDQRVHILARNVGIVLKEPQETSSFLNSLPATVIEISEPDENHYAVKIKLDIGVPLLASISRKSLHILGLSLGMSCYALIKAVSLSRS